MGYQALLQEIFPTQGSNLRLLCLLGWRGGVGSSLLESSVSVICYYVTNQTWRLTKTAAAHRFSVQTGLARNTHLCSIERHLR